MGSNNELSLKKEIIEDDVLTEFDFSEIKKTNNQKYVVGEFYDENGNYKVAFLSSPLPFHKMIVENFESKTGYKLKLFGGGKVEVNNNQIRFYEKSGSYGGVEYRLLAKVFRNSSLKNDFSKVLIDIFKKNQPTKFFKEGGYSRKYKIKLFGNSDDYEIFPGESLFLDHKDFGEHLIDGFNSDDYALFKVIKENNYEVLLENGHPGFLFTYIKRRLLPLNCSKLEVKLGLFDEETSTPEKINCNISSLYTTGTDSGDIDPIVSVSSNGVRVTDKIANFNIALKDLGVKYIDTPFNQKSVENLIKNKYNKNILDYINEIKKLDDDRFIAIHYCETGYSGYSSAVIVDRDFNLTEITNTRETQAYLHLDDVIEKFNIKLKQKKSR